MGIYIYFLDLLFFIVKFFYFDVFDNYHVFTLNREFNTCSEFPFSLPHLEVRNTVGRLENVERPSRSAMTLLRSEIPSGICAKLRTVAARNNRVHMP